MMMDVVQHFNDELQSLVDMKPPVSKAKMGQITRAAMKGVKFYKHIVLSVEKFVSRCTPEYKVPGLYVIDSIVRQSRHQFGIDRDVYATRFSRNLGITFENLFAGCLPDDKPKMVRVLNLWQKNGVFNSHIIQPLLDMASPSATLQLDPKSPMASDCGSLRLGGQTSKYNHYKNSGSSTSASERHQRAGEANLKFNKNMLDFDYDEDDEDDGDETPTEAEPPLSSTLSKIEMEHRAKRIEKSSNSNNLPHQSSQTKANSEQPSPRPKQQQSSQDPVLERWNKIIRQQSSPYNSPMENNQHSLTDARGLRRSRSRSPPVPSHQQTLYSNQSTSATRAPPVYPISGNLLSSNIQTPIKDNGNEASENDLQKSPSPHDKERLKERERKCLPKIRDKHLTVCSSTLWLGHVPKNVSEADISDAFGEFGTINSIDLIPPRGCAYVCMDRRQDAKRALLESRDLKLNGSHIKMAWAPGKGFKEYKKLKDFWEADVGASFIPYSKIDDSIDFDTLEEGGVIDEDSMSLGMRERRERGNDDRGKESNNTQPTSSKAPPTSGTGLNLPLPVLPLLNQPPPQPTGLQSFVIPPPSMTIPPPVGLGQGMIPFPPPGVVTTASSVNQLMAGPPIFTVTSQSSSTNEAYNVHEKSGASESSPLSLDQQLSMTERQISMVEQQLNMIQQAQGGGRPQAPHQLQPMQALGPHALFYGQNQPNPMMFELPPQHSMLHGAQPMLDSQQMAMFMSHPLSMIGSGQPIIPMSEAGMMDPSGLGGMAPNHGGF